MSKVGIPWLLSGRFIFNSYIIWTFRKKISITSAFNIDNFHVYQNMKYNFCSGLNELKIIMNMIIQHKFKEAHFKNVNRTIIYW